jgi:aminomethyltransferase
VHRDLASALDPATVAATRLRGIAPGAPGGRRLVRAGESVQLAVRQGDELTLTHVDGGAALWLLALDARGAPAAAVVQVDAASACLLPSAAFTSLPAAPAEVPGWVVGGAATPAGASFRLRVGADAVLCCAAPLLPGALEGGGGATATIGFNQQAQAPELPEPLGVPREEIRVPRRTARAYRVRQGELIQIIDVQGRQCSDFMALREDALAQGIERFIDSTVTRTLVGGAYPGPGLFDKYFDQDMRPLLAVVQDTVGRHDTFALACTARGYEERGFPGHDNCSDNISDALAPHGVTRRVAWPAINLFFNSWILPGDNRLRSDEAWSRPGDYVVLRALTDLLCVTTACPDDIDPINGWDPTDIHVRIYPPNPQLPVALAYRSEPTAEPSLTQPSAFHARTSALTRQYAPARDLWLPTRYDATHVLEEYRACREAVTLQDLSSLRKFDVVGPDAERLLDLCMTRDVRRLSVLRGTYTLVCDEAGSVIDDGTLFRLAPDLFRWCPSSEQSAQHLKDVALRRGFEVWIRAHHASMPNLALQGPRSRELLRALVFTQPTVASVDALKWFGVTIGRLRDRDGASLMLTRTGYTGELGYELFCHRAQALEVWDALLQAGEPLGLKPMGSEALGILRVEAGLAAQGAEFGSDIDAYEAGLGLAVDLNKPEFIGRDALARIQAAPRRVLTGLVLGGTEVPAHGDPVFDGRQRVGTVTSAVRSPALGCAIAMARLVAERAAPGTALEVGRLDGQLKRLGCRTIAMPFVDPQRTRVRS